MMARELKTQPTPPSWADLQLLHVIAQEGSLTAAARRLEISQPTAGRRLKALERALGASVFARRADGLAPTPFGAQMLDALAEMESAALAFQRIASATARDVQEVLHVTCLDWVANCLLGELVGRFTQAHPWIAVELHVDDRKVNLSRAEADVALRFSPFEQLDLVQRRVCALPGGLFASAEYLERHGTPRFDEGCAGHSVLSMPSWATHVADQQWLRRTASRARVVITSNSLTALARAALAHAGITVLPQVVGRGVGLTELAPPQPIPPRELWIGYHKDLRRLERVKRFVDYVVAQLGDSAPSKKVRA